VYVYRTQCEHQFKKVTRRFMNVAFSNGIIETGDDSLERDRLFVGNGRIQVWPATLPDDTQLIDLDGGYLRAGFADGHAHPFLAGREWLGPRLRHCESVDEIVQEVQLWGEENLDATWIAGGSYDATIVPGGLFEAAWLDAIHRPVVLRSWDYHTVWCNSRALELAGITAETEDPPFGRIVRREDGTPTGTLLESATSLVLDLVPEPSLEQRVEILSDATQLLASHGITWAQEAWAENHELQAWQDAARRGALAIDLDLAVRADPLRWPEQLEEICQARGQFEGFDGLSLDTVKFFVDGIIENHTASMLEEYADDCSRGLPNWTVDGLKAALVDVHETDFDIHLHAIGDAGVRAALDAIEELRRQDPNGTRRITIAHAQVIHPHDLGRFAELGVAVCFQPLWARPDEIMTSLTLPRLGQHRQVQYQMGSVLRSGATITFGSDWPVSSPNVLEGITTAVTRQNPDGSPHGGWQPEERLTVAQALATASAAVRVQSRRGKDRGIIAAGNQADLVWLSHNPLTCNPEDIGSVRVLATWRRGKNTFLVHDPETLETSRGRVANGSPAAEPHRRTKL
jgi:predicted amidohydrolase YtcJ